MGLAVDVFAVTQGEHYDGQGGVGDGIQDAEVADSNPVAGTVGELCRSRWNWGVAQEFEGCGNASPIAGLETE